MVLLADWIEIRNGFRFYVDVSPVSSLYSHSNHTTTDRDKLHVYRELELVGSFSREELTVCTTTGTLKQESSYTHCATQLHLS